MVATTCSFAEEQPLFARLGVFAGGCTLAAAEAVAEADVDTIQSLVEKSLLRHTDGRFWMLETIREYAVERLEEHPDSGELRRGYAEFFLALAESANLSVERCTRGTGASRARASRNGEPTCRARLGGGARP